MKHYRYETFVNTFPKENGARYDKCKFWIMTLPDEQPADLPADVSINDCTFDFYCEIPGSAYGLMDFLVASGECCHCTFINHKAAAEAAKEKP